MGDDKNGKKYSGAFVAGPQPVWCHFAFVDIFADPYIDAKQRKLERQYPGIVCLAKSLKLYNSVLQRMLGEPLGDYAKHIGHLSRLYTEALQIGARLPIGKVDDPDGNFLTFLQFFVGRVGALRPGESLLFPGGWRCETKEGHAIMFLLHRHQSAFALGLSNTGGIIVTDEDDNGLNYHPGKAECTPPKMKRAMSIVCEDIPTERLLDSSFWFMLFKQLVYPSDNNGPRELYEILLPYLNNRPFSANAYVNPRFLTKNDVVGNGNQPVQYNSNLPQGVDDTPMNCGARVASLVVAQRGHGAKCHV